MDHDLARTLTRRLFDFNIELHLTAGLRLDDLLPGEPGRALLVHPAAESDCTIVYSPSMTLTDLARFEAAWEGPGTAFVLGPKVSPRSADQLRSLGVHYLDAAGNAFFQFANVLIDVRGRSTHTGTRDVGIAKPMNLFSRGRAQVMFVVLSWPSLLKGSQRRIAEAAKVSVGQANDTLSLLEVAGYLDSKPGGSQLRRRDELIESWTAAYGTGLGAPRDELRFAGDPGDIQTIPDVHVQLSGEVAVTEWLRPATATLYVDEFSPKFFAANRWRTDRDPNIFVRRTFWSSPTHRTHEPQTRTAPPLLIYADLWSSDESRQREAATRLRRETNALRAD